MSIDSTKPSPRTIQKCLPTRNDRHVEIQTGRNMSAAAQAHRRSYMSRLEQRRIFALRHRHAPLQVPPGRRGRRVRDAPLRRAQQMTPVPATRHRKGVVAQVQTQCANVRRAQGEVRQALAETAVGLHREGVRGLVEQAVLEGNALRDWAFVGRYRLDAFVARERCGSVLLLHRHAPGVCRRSRRWLIHFHGPATTTHPL